MIEQLMVKNYILFDYALVDFSSGMSVITGETGAGKSLLIDAISYLCGNRAGSDIVRKGKDKCILQMVLSKPNDSIIEELEEEGFDIDDELIISRTILSSGKSTMRLNQQVTTASFVKILMAKLLDVHSQMDTYQLMNPTVQMDLLDRYAKAEPLKEQVKMAYRLYREIYEQYEELKNETFSDDELDYMTHQYNEIEDMHVEENELETLQQRIKEASTFQKSLEEYQNATYLLDKENGILDMLYQLNRIVSKNKGLEEFDEMTNDAYHQFVSLSEEIKDKQERFQNEVLDLDAMQEREYAIRKLFRKHGGSYESMMANKEKYLEKIDRILHRQDVFEKLEKKLKSLKQDYIKQAKALHDARVAVLEDLTKQIESHFKDLMLENARFKVDMQDKDMGSDGMDLIDFTVSMNKGQPFSSLKKSASGGELSRLMLALKVVFQSQNGIETIIFDEIDTGVSGKVAFAMGKKMHDLSSSYQVLCITHLASVASWADSHYCVEKKTNNELTSTTVSELDDEKTIQQLAIMTTGELTNDSYNMAFELRKRAHG